MSNADTMAAKLFPLDSLDAWLKSQLDNLQGQPKINIFKGGASNITCLISYENRQLIVRRPPPGTRAKGAHDMGREARLLQSLKPHFAKVPKVYAFCQDSEVIGDEFVVVEYLDGLILRRNLPKDLALTADDCAGLCQSFLQTLSELHQVKIDDSFDWMNRGKGYVARQITGWSKRYRAAQTPDAADYDQVIQWLEGEQPEDCAQCLIHNDYRFDNLVLNPDNPQQVIGVLDWELATVGDPLMELGSSLAYWVEADDDGPLMQFRLQPTHLEGMYTRQALLDSYLQRMGLSLNQGFTFYEVYGLFRLAGIAQQIYYRYYHGQFKEERFAGFIHIVNYLQQRCLKIIKGQS